MPIIFMFGPDGVLDKEPSGVFGDKIRPPNLSPNLPTLEHIIRHIFMKSPRINTHLLRKQGISWHSFSWMCVPTCHSLLYFLVIGVINAGEYLIFWRIFGCCSFYLSVHNIFRFACSSGVTFMDFSVAFDR